MGSLQTSRRTFLGLMGAAALSQAWECVAHPMGSGQLPAYIVHTQEGTDLTGWELTLGDALYAQPDEPPVTMADIAISHLVEYSEIRANVEARDIMAHAIAFRRIQDAQAFEAIHRVGYSFRLPYLPVKDAWDLNGQTLEGGFFIWDGSDTRLDYGLAFQWILNPWMAESGEIRCWTSRSGGQWQAVGELALDTAWHSLTMTLDFRRRTTALTIDGTYYPCQFTETPKPSNWGLTTDARLQAEIVSLYPGAEGNGALHKAWFKDWFWEWEPYNGCSTYLPTVMR